MFLTLVATLLLPVHQFSAVPTRAVQDEPGPFGYELQLAKGEHLLRYAWDGGDPVPCVSAGPSVSIVHGELGLSADARLYLPANSLDECATTRARVLAGHGVALVDGRYRGGLGFGRSSLLKFALPAQDPQANGWTLSFWLRPAAAAFGRPLVLLPGAVEVLLQGDGRVRATLLPGDPPLSNPRPLARDKWSFVLVSYDPLFTRQLRLIVDAEPVSANFRAAPPARLAVELWAGDLGRNGQGFEGVLDELSLVPRPLSTEQAHHAARRPLAPGNHRLEIVTDRGQRTVTPAALPTREFVLDTAADFALGQLDGVEVANGVLRWVPARWRELATDLAPPPRTAHPTVYLGRQRLFTFGGETRDTHLWPGLNSDDTWLFDGAKGTWERVPTTVGPSVRCHVPGAYSPDHDVVLLVGGWRNDIAPNLNFDDTWVFHVSQRRWEQRFPGGDRVGTGSAYGLLYLPALKRFLLLQNNRNLLYDPVADRWQILPAARTVTASGQPTTYSVGISPICALDARTGLVLIFGGSFGNPVVYSDKTALYDVATNTFTVLAPAAHPSARVRGAFAHDPKRGVFALFGGVQGQFSQRHDDLWLFDPRSRQWSELGCSNRPSARGGYYGMAYDDVADRFVLFGGRNSPERWLDETWTLELAGGRTGTALYTFDRLQDWGRSSWFADVQTPGSSAVKFLFRAGDSGSEWSQWSPSTAHLGSRRFVQAIAFLKPGASGETPTIQRMGLR